MLPLLYFVNYLGPFELAHMHMICKLKHAIYIKRGVRCCTHLYVRAVCRFIMGYGGRCMVM